MAKGLGNDAAALHAKVEEIMSAKVLVVAGLPVLAHVHHGETVTTLRATAPGLRPSAALAARDSAWPRLRAA